MITLKQYLKILDSQEKKYIVKYVSPEQNLVINAFNFDFDDQNNCVKSFTTDKNEYKGIEINPEAFMPFICVDGKDLENLRLFNTPFFAVLVEDPLWEEFDEAMNRIEYVKSDLRPNSYSLDMMNELDWATDTLQKLFDKIFLSR